MKLLDLIVNIMKSKKVKQELSILGDGFEINNGNASNQVLWNEIGTITAFKRDLLTEDQICLEIQVGSNSFYCSEDFKGWIEFEEELRRHLPQIDVNWINNLAKPAFKESRTLVYSRESYHCSVCGESHEEWPALAFISPDPYFQLSQSEKESIGSLSEDFCTISYEDQVDRFIRVILKQRIINSDEVLDYGVWISLSEQNFEDYKSNFQEKNHEREYFGWLSNAIPNYENTTNIPTTVVTGTGTDRPEIFPHENFEHPFVTDYYNGISREEAEKRIHEMNETLGNMG